MSAGNSSVKAHDDTQNKAEGIRQGAAAPNATRATIVTAEVLFHRAVVKSALANNVSASSSMMALKELGVTGQ